MQTLTQPRQEAHAESMRDSNPEPFHNLNRLEFSDPDQVIIANQSLPFFRGYAPSRGIQYSALND